MAVRSALAATLLFSACVAALAFAGLWLSTRPFTLEHGAVLLYFATVTGLLLHWQEAVLHSDPKGMVQRFMAGLIIKMFLSIGVLVVLLFVAEGDRVLELGLFFGAAYLLFLGFSTVRLQWRLRGGT